MSDPAVHIGVLSLELYFPGTGSLKSKRSIVKSLIERIRSSFNVSASEIGELDKWQKSFCAVAMISNDQKYLDAALHKVLSFVEDVKTLEVVDYQIAFI